MGFAILSLRKVIDSFPNDSLYKPSDLLACFNCRLNADEEDFLREKAITYENQNKARTFLVADEKGIRAYFTLAFKSIDLKNVSNSFKKTLTAGESNADSYPVFLIGHIAKDDSVIEHIGDDILQSALDLLLEAQKIVGGRLVYLDCRNEEKLKRFYERNGFKFFNTSSKSGLLQYYKKL